MTLTRMIVPTMLSCVLLAAQVEGGSPPAARTSDPVVQWNRTLLTIVRTPGAQPAAIHPTRAFALMHAAIYDAVNGIARLYTPYAIDLSDTPHSASQPAAASAAAHDVLVALYPAFTDALDAELQRSLADIADTVNVADGVKAGQIVADRLLALRANDGSTAPPTLYQFGRGAGAYQSTPPNFPAQPQFIHWGSVAPFVLESGSQFRPDPPPALTSDAYAKSLAQVQTLGVGGSTAATPDEALVGRFWNGPIQNYWNEIAQSVSASHHMTTVQSARLFALLNLTIADSVIAFYDAKYTYNFWRPVTAIRAADADGNPETAVDVNWLPEVGNTPADPSYPGAHAVVSAVGLAVLTSVLGHDRFDLTVTSEVLPGVERRFTSLAGAAEEATFSRVFAGVHFPFDLTTGQQLGRDVAGFVLEHALTRRGPHAASTADGRRVSAAIHGATIAAHSATTPH
jgi:membrane-associated phospholipid phosphatase